MNFSLLNVALFGVGALLIVSAIKDTTPREIISTAISTNTIKPEKNRPAVTGNTVTGNTEIVAGITNPNYTPGVIVTSP